MAAQRGAKKPQGPAVLPKGGPAPRAAGQGAKGSGNNPLVVGIPKRAVGKRGSNGS